MFGHILFLQVCAIVVKSRPEIVKETTQNDANLNPGFDLEAFRVNQLNLHNYYRALHGVPPMTMDPELEIEAQEYAEKLAADNKGMVHCNLPKCDRHGAGENLAAGWGTTTVELNATKAWYNEVWDYNYCNQGKRPGHEHRQIGHFTQVIWRTSTKLGIGYARTKDRKKVYVVGRYWKHGNVRGQFAENVPKAEYLLKTFEDNCEGINGSLSVWSEPGECSRSCGGGIRFQTRTCTDPKPSWNGADCTGITRRMAEHEWCNIESCSGELSYRAQQCKARGSTPKAYNFHGKYECILHCYSSGNTYMHTGKVDDGTHCNKDNGVCLNGKCEEMPKYVAQTEPPTLPPTAWSGTVTGNYNDTPSSNIWKNKILTVPIGATNVLITNKDYNNVRMYVGYTKPRSSGYEWAEMAWMNSWVKHYGSYSTQKTIVGVTFTYLRTPEYSALAVTGPVEPDPGSKLVLFVKGSSRANISWSYEI